MFAYSDIHFEGILTAAAKITMYCSLVVWKLLFNEYILKLHLKLSALDHAIKKSKTQTAEDHDFNYFPNC